MVCLDLVLLFFLNLSQAVNPTPKLLSLIPYPEIAQDIITYSEEKNISTAYLSGGSLSLLAVEREITKRAPQLMTDRLKKEAITTLESGDTCVLIANYMTEGNSFNDIPKLLPDAQFERGYTKLSELPFNSIWTQRTVNSAQQPYAFMTYSLNCDQN